MKCVRRVLCTEGQRCSVHASFPWQLQLLPPHLFVLAESPAALCAETAKRGETISPPPATRRRGQQQAGREQKPCLHQQYGVLGGGRQSRKDTEFLFWWETALPPMCKSANSLPSAAQVNKQHVPCLVLPELPALVCWVKVQGGETHIIRDEKFKSCFHAGIPVQNKMEGD